MCEAKSDELLANKAYENFKGPVDLFLHAGTQAVSVCG